MKVKSWETFQHYKDRSPPWIKLHKSLLDNYEFQRLPIASKALAPMLWLLASEEVDGNFDGNPEKLAFRLRWAQLDIIEGMKPLIKEGFIVLDSNELAECYQDAMPETEKEAERERETEKRKRQTLRKNALDDDFENFWKAYPKKVGKADALKAWNKIKPQIENVLTALSWQRESQQWLKEDGQFIPNPSTYINQGRWQDEPPANNNNSLGEAGRATAASAKRFIESMEGLQNDK